MTLPSRVLRYTRVTCRRRGRGAPFGALVPSGWHAGLRTPGGVPGCGGHLIRSAGEHFASAASWEWCTRVVLRNCDVMVPRWSALSVRARTEASNPTAEDAHAQCLLIITVPRARFGESWQDPYGVLHNPASYGFALLYYRSLREVDCVRRLSR